MGTALVAIPIGVGGTIYLAEYVRDTCMSRCIRLAIVNLAGIPSIVYGLFGLGMFLLYLKMSTSIVAGALTLAIMILPVIIGRAEEALRAVPTEFRTVSATLGGTRWQGIRYIILPQALPGIITGVILGLLGAAGETAPILFTVAAFFLPRLPHSPFDQTMAFPYHLYVISTLIDIPRMAEKARDMLHRALQAFIGRDAELTRAIPVEDDKMDALYEQIFRELTAYCMGRPQTGQWGQLSCLGGPYNL